VFAEPHLPWDSSTAASSFAAIVFGASTFFITIMHMAPKPARQCFNLGIDGGIHATKIVVSTKNAVIPVWPNECNLQKVFSAIKATAKDIWLHRRESRCRTAKSLIALHQNLR